MLESKKILVAVLNWGLGHATRCIPIIKELKKNNLTPIIASDGYALKLLCKEFPDLDYYVLPSYNIKYTKKGKYFKYKMILKTPKIASAIFKEKQFINNLIKNKNINGIISDNRFGIYHKKTPSIFITHQINVLSGNTTRISTYLHQKCIKKFNECWVPDLEDKINLSGKLGHTNDKKLKFQ